MQMTPILKALRKHKIPATLILLEVALAMVVFCNALSMLGQHVAALNAPNAIDQSGIVVVYVNGTNRKLAHVEIPRNLAALRKIPGVAAATSIDMVPLSNYIMFGGPAATKRNRVGQAGSTMAGLYGFTRQGPSALGLRLLRGRLFNKDEYTDAPKFDDGNLSGDSGIVPVVITESLAEHLWPGRTALGKQFFTGATKEYTVVGVVRNVVLPANVAGHGNFANAIFSPVRAGPGMHYYILRTRPQDRKAVLRDAVAKVKALSPEAVVTGKTFTAIRRQYFAATRSLVWILALVCILMLAITACSIGGLTTFWVNQRRHQIGIRRALGATRRSILRYFQVENFVLSSAGVVLGLIVAYGANLYLVAHYQLTLMPWYYPVLGAIALWALGQVAVLGPALRAAAVPPAVATRNV